MKIEDLKDLRYYGYPIATYGKVQSPKGAVDEIEITAEGYYGNQKVFVTTYKKVKCLAIFNPFICEYFVDDVYTVLKGDDNGTE